MLKVDLYIRRNAKKFYLRNQEAQLNSDLSVDPCNLSLSDEVPNSLHKRHAVSPEQLLQAQAQAYIQ
jgi:hypothetical protein